jgi:hypothetical protein
MILKGFLNDIILERILKHIFTLEYNVTFFLIKLSYDFLQLTNGIFLIYTQSSY